ncbi:ribonuclease P [Haloprofundus marisrubri]|uniref:Ribonuclease P protein component 1 n=1 Tax=Haloprofundus marisrubri TaxID=1514971 RepID=A0A0W1R7R0_9EURY|nr:ribonuclease P protein subunit [Haloprofundus marisrubri]KTG09249.1 ribonuclease P [Haloprofundus marisrubri]
MALTPERLTRHELNGLPIRVAAADNPDLVGIAGRVVVETMQTLHVDCDVSAASRLFGDDVAERGARVVQVPKRGTTFEFALEQRDGGSNGPPRTNEAAGNRRHHLDESSDTRRRRRKAPGSASKRESETAGNLAGQSGSTREGSSDDGSSGDCEGVVYVTVDGANLLSRPALRTENVGESTWR